MGNLLVVTHDAAHDEAAARWFDAGLRTARDAHGQQPRQVVTSDGVRIATFSRRNGSGGQVVIDADSGDWLCAIGTWFHESGYGPGRERRLLGRAREVGVDALASELEGLFVVVIGRRETGAIRVITDPIGSCHAFVRVDDHVLALSGSASLLASLAPTGLDVVAAQEYVQTGIVYEERTFYSAVRRLEPAAVYDVHDGRLGSPHSHWPLAANVGRELSADEAIARWIDAMTDVAKRIGETFKRPVCDLTGGYDSRALAATLRTGGLSFETTVSGPPDSDDVRVSSGLAARCGFEHHHVEATPPSTLADLESAARVCDGEVDVVDYAHVLNIHEELRSRFDISLNGSFGELARGYWWELLFPGLSDTTPLDAERIARHRYAAGAIDLDLFPAEQRIDPIAHFAGVIRRTNADLPEAPRTFQLDHCYLRMRMRCWQGRFASATNRIWPCLAPFMFRPVLEVLLQAEPRARLRGLIVRRLLERIQPMMASYPLADGYPAMPARLSNAHRFVPLGWLYAKKLLKRAVPHAMRRKSADHVQAIRDALWSDAALRAVLAPDQMRIAEHLDRDALRRFVEQSRGAGFRGGAQWSRLLSLELALRHAGV